MKVEQFTLAICDLLNYFDISVTVHDGDIIVENDKKRIIFIDWSSLGLLYI